jgi:hypothetical protein
MNDFFDCVGKLKIDFFGCVGKLKIDLFGCVRMNDFFGCVGMNVQIAQKNPHLAIPTSCIWDDY